MASLTLYGGCSYDNASIENASPSYGMDNKLAEMQENPLGNIAWKDNTVLCANFTYDLSASNFEGNFQNIHHYRIYKAHSNQPELYKVYETNSVHENIVEDFAVGSECAYTYYIVPICTDENGDFVTGSVIKSDEIMLHDSTVRVIGLIRDKDDLDTYYIDTNNIWNFALNISDEGFNNNMGKTYNDTPQRFPIEIKNEGFYRSFNISGLLGKFDCESQQYINTYDDIIEWERFVNNGEMKLVIDLHGIMTVGTMDSNGFNYGSNAARSVTANFSVKQLEDISKINIINRGLWINPLSGEQFLADTNNLVLREVDSAYLVTKGGEE